MAIDKAAVAQKDSRTHSREAPPMAMVPLTPVAGVDDERASISAAVSTVLPLPAFPKRALSCRKQLSF